MRRYVIFSLFLLLVNATVILAGNNAVTASTYTISGYVLTNAGLPVVNAVVSDGYSVVRTNGNGYYSFTRNNNTEFVFISLPEAYEMPMGNDGSPHLYAKVSDTGNFSNTFVLTPFADGGAADSSHVMIAISDPQVRADYETWRFRNEGIKDMIKLKNSYPEGTRFYGVVVGDQVFDDYARMEEHQASCNMLGFPVFQVIGNHDCDRYISDDAGSEHYFKALYGPTYYSFNRGKIHYVVLDDIEYLGAKEFNNNITQNQIDWLTKDLTLVPAEKSIVFLVHAPFQGSNVGNRTAVYNLLASRNTVQHHLISGHSHCNNNTVIYSYLMDHNLGSADGAFWAGDYCFDGTPNGYGVFQAGKEGFSNWFYKSTGCDKRFQFNVFPVNSVNTGDGKTGCIIANVWNYDSNWSVNIYEDGFKKVMQKYTGLDPKMFDYLALDGDTRPNYPGIDGGLTLLSNPGVERSTHLFSYKPAHPDAEFIVEVTDRFARLYRQKVLRNMMVAGFSQEGNDWVYHQDFNTLPGYPNQLVETTLLAKGTFVQGHTPEGWYACTSGAISPAGGNSVTWSQFNYLRINNGDQADGWLYSYGAGNPASASQNDSERSLGSVTSLNQRGIDFGVLIENNTDQTLSGLGIKYTGKMWRTGKNPSSRQKLTFSYAINPDAAAIRDRNIWIAEVTTTTAESLSFQSPEKNVAVLQGLSNAALDGNATENQVLVEGKVNAPLLPGEVLLLRWDNTFNADSNHGLSIDDLTVRALVESATNVVPAIKSDCSFYNRGKTLYFSQIPASDVMVYDIAGHIVYRQKINTHVLNLEGFVRQGVYLVQTGYTVQKIVF